MQVFNKNCLINKRILITGASSGIGRKSAELFNSCGAYVILVGRNEKKLKEISSKLEKKERSSYFITDLSVPDSACDCVNKISKDQPPLDGVFHSAGQELIKPLSLTKDRDLNLVLSSTLNSALSLSRALTKRSIFRNGGSIVFMSSIAAIAGSPGMSAYSASKGAINSLSRSLALEFAPRNIRVNTINAGAVKTSMHERLINNLSPTAASDYELKHPLGIGESIDIANLATFLMSDASKWITGSEINIDGGYTAK